MEPIAASTLKDETTPWGAAPQAAKQGKKRKRLQKKAPGAPKRGKSPYILFSMDKREEIKSKMPADAKVTDIMRAIADAWAKMGEEDKQPWKIAAEQDKQRYEKEMAEYDGPLRVPNKRAKKHPDAPKRASSAFLFYSQVMRPRIKAEHADMKNTEISKQLGEAWAKATDEQKAPFVEKERADRARYKREMEAWNNGEPLPQAPPEEEKLVLEGDAKIHLETPNVEAKFEVDDGNDNDDHKYPDNLDLDTLGYPNSYSVGNI